MAHNLNFKNGVASFASKKEPAWHGLGKVVQAMNSAEAIKLGGLDFEVEKRSLLVEGKKILWDDAKNDTIVLRTKENTEGIITAGGIVNQYYSINAFTDRFATVRTDNNFPLGIVGSKYEVIQNSEAFDFIDSIIGEGIADYETVGCLGNGETVFITCKIKEECLVNKEQIDNYLLLTMSHDGSSSIVIMFTPVRVVCNNTLTLALKGSRNKVTIKHTIKARERMDNAKKVLGLIDQQTLVHKEAFGELFNIHVPDDYAKHIIEKSLSVVRDSKGNLSGKAQNTMKAAYGFYQEGLGQADIVGTGWGVLNGVTGYLQNVKEFKSSEVKFNSTFNGTGVAARQTAYDLILSLN